MTPYAFQQVDVFTAVPLKGNPLAVVIGADGLSDDTMAALARWTNLSETTFLLQPTDPGADYRVRIFTPVVEYPFAGHPTLGTCHVWLANGGKTRGGEIVQQCAAGLIRIRHDEGRLAFAAPPLNRSGPVDPSLLDRIAKGLSIDPQAIRASNWTDNGPGWISLLLGSRAEVMSLKPDNAALSGLALGIVAPWDPATDGTEAQFEVRAFVPALAKEDPVTGSLNAGIAQWLIGAGLAPASYVASQGAKLGRAGRVYVTQSGPDIWIGGNVVTCIAGTLTL